MCLELKWLHISQECDDATLGCDDHIPSPIFIQVQINYKQNIDILCIGLGKMMIYYGDITIFRGNLTIYYENITIFYRNITIY